MSVCAPPMMKIASRSAVDGQPSAVVFIKGESMPTIFNASDLNSTRNQGVTNTTIADRAMLGSDALRVERITLESEAHTAPISASEAESFLYVIRGSGQASVNSGAFALEPESLLWIESGDVYTLEAGVDGLELLVWHSPAS